MRLAALLFALFATPLAAQSATTADGGILRVLDKITGQVTDLELDAGQTGTVGGLTVTLNECRYPSDNQSGDAFELLTIYYRENTEPVFQGWMIASDPSVNAMEHSRYDVWPLRCTTS